MRINPGIHVLVLSLTARQFGLGPDALVVRGLQAGDVEFLAVLRAGVPDGAETAAARQCSVPAQRARALISALSPVLVSYADTAEPPGQAVPALRLERLAGDLDHLSASYRMNAGACARSRARAVVEVSGLSRIGALLARTLAGAGVGTLVLSDPGVVLPSDVGAAYPLTDLGMGRAQAVKRHIYRLDPTVQVLPTTSPEQSLRAGNLDLAVVVGGPPIAGRQTGLPTREHPLLSVTVHEAGIDVGPLVVPGLTPCLECLELQLIDGDSTWHDASEALGRQQVEARPAGEETAGAVSAAGTAAAQVLSFLDGVVQPVTWSAVLSLRAADGYAGLKRLAFHPKCGCRLQRKNTPAQAS
ncbi:ThiF family adenylyltransferase [Arthrobacter sunyaminii]|uniref:ThiF family adenylyltransferase n=1 Tax=Arthrobacter sunyaminii TaxID=2816859 RepID=UPI001A93CEC8|nr:ThiF family adenylyltransferase [Arthrobacter sunyaminii]MBO0897844.1 hypothetical protein [Arthrobacter sunyaminii]